MLSLKVVLHNFLTSPEHRPQPNIAHLYMSSHVSTSKPLEQLPHLL